MSQLEDVARQKSLHEETCSDALKLAHDINEDVMAGEGEIAAAIQAGFDYREAELRAALASVTAERDALERAAQHDAAGREAIARWMIGRSYATGHGDTIEALLVELEGYAHARGQVLEAEASKLNLDTAIARIRTLEDDVQAGLKYCRRLTNRLADLIQASRPFVDCITIVDRMTNRPDDENAVTGLAWKDASQVKMLTWSDFRRLREAIAEAPKDSELPYDELDEAMDLYEGLVNEVTGTTRREKDLIIGNTKAFVRMLRQDSGQRTTAAEALIAEVREVLARVAKKSGEHHETMRKARDGTELWFAESFRSIESDCRAALAKLTEAHT